MHRRSAISLMVSAALLATESHARKRAMTACSVDLPNHTIDYSVPTEVARQMGEWRLHRSFDPASGFERGFRPLVNMMYDFNGPFWHGANGSLKFHVFLQEREANFEGDITTVEGLEKYIGWWSPLVLKIGVLSHTELNGAPVVSRQLGDYIETLSFPIDQQMFVDFGLSVESIPGGKSSNTSWIKKAVAMRDAIRASITFRPKLLSTPFDGPRVS